MVFKKAGLACIIEQNVKYRLFCSSTRPWNSSVLENVTYSGKYTEK